MCAYRVATLRMYPGNSTIENEEECTKATSMILRHIKRQSGNLVLFALMAIVGLSCVKKHPTQLNPNQPPRSYFWLAPDSAIADGISKQHLYWWGEDADGIVQGYLLAIVPDCAAIPDPDTLTYFYTTRTDSVLSFPIRQAQQTFLVALRAIDNSVPVSLPEGARVRLMPVIFWDKNVNGVFDAGDGELSSLQNAIDWNGARQQFPIKNSPPTIHYVGDAADVSVNAEPPEVTFPVASFSWTGSDIDGDETIVSYRIALNDSLFISPVTVSSAYTTVTLSAPRAWTDTATADVPVQVLVGSFPNLRTVGTLHGLRLEDTNKVYVQAVDVAGDRSAPLRFPSAGRTWYVARPHGKLLIVADYIGGGDSAAVRRFYMDSVFANIPSVAADGYDFLSIRTGTTSTRSLGSKVPALQHINPAFILTLKLYECVLWYTDGTPSYAIAQYSLPQYCTAGGHVIFTTKFVDPSNNGDPANALRDIVPIDTLSQTALRDTTGVAVTRFSGSVLSDSYPPLAFKLRLQTGMTIYPIVKNAAAQYLYYLPAAAYPQTPVGVIDEGKRIIFLTIPLERMSAVYPSDGGVIKFFEKAFRDFGIYE